MDDGRSRSRQDSVQRRRLEAQRIAPMRTRAASSPGSRGAPDSLDRLGPPLAGPVAGRGAYQVMRPARGRERVPGTDRRRMARGSDGPPPATRELAGGLPAAPPPVAPVPRAAVDREEDRTLDVAPRLWEPPRAAAPRRRRRGSDWVLPMTVACIVSTGIVLLAALLP